MKKLLIALLAIMACSTLVLVQGQDDDPEGRLDLKVYTCSQHIEIVESEDGRGDVRTVWAHGYYSARRGVDEHSAPVTAQMIVDFAQELESICRGNLDKLFITAVKEVQ